LTNPQLRHDVGPAWPPIPDPPPDPPRWADANALTGVWRDSLTMALGGRHPELVKRLPENARPDGPWNIAPEPESDADIAQAISAKAHLSFRMLPLLAEAQLVGLAPLLADVLAVPAPDEQLLEYGPTAKLPATPMFLDLEAEDGRPVMWRADTWPRPFNLRGALCWQDPVGLNVIPFGSVDGIHLIGGTDYQPWARIIYLTGPAESARPCGPGDLMVDAAGDAVAWVQVDSDSFCAHQTRIASNLAFGALSLLMFLDRLEVPLVTRPLPRPARRRAQRGGERIGLVPEGMPEVLSRRPAVASDDADEDIPRDAVECPVGPAHARLDQAHVLWHEALDAYEDPELFATKLNALLTAMRSVTFVLQKQLRHVDGFNAWYEQRQEQMKADPLMRWLVDARNAIEKQGDLDAASVAVVRIEGPWGGALEQTIDVDVDATPTEIARRIRVGAGLPGRVVREGVLVVERRWTVEPLDGREILDALAHCFGVLASVIDGSHRHAEVPLERCETTYRDEHHAALLALGPSGRAPCMAASVESRTSRRNLSSGAPVVVASKEIRRPSPADIERVTAHYGFSDQDRPPEDLDPIGQTQYLHDIGRRMLAKDGYHDTFVWMFRDDEALGMHLLRPEDQRDKHLMIQKVAADVTERSADRVVFAAELWEAPAVDRDDDRVRLRAEERDDRTESFVTVLLRRAERSIVFRSPIIRDGDTVTLGDAKRVDGQTPPFLAPIVAEWEAWPH
jgi:hypothetical protein